MAIKKTTTVQRIEVYPLQDATAAASANAKHPTLMVVYVDTFDDSSDDDLPVSTSKTKHLTKFVEDGGAATDYSKEDELVKTICAAIWA
tara:strand:+ start:1165 stop:1431 length:267 start_codon:yes stop_codon:yes gene_type:complete